MNEDPTLLFQSNLIHIDCFSMIGICMIKEATVPAKHLFLLDSE